MRYAFIQRHRLAWPARTLCRILQVRPSGYYRWRDRIPGSREVARLRLVESIRSVHERSRGRYGSPRVHQALRRQGLVCSRNHVARLMREHQLRARSPRAFRLRTTDSDHVFPVALNRLDRQFHPTTLNTVWGADLTYVASDEGWLYVASVMDLCSRRIIGWATADHLRAELPLQALERALRDRRPPAGLVHHSDRGVQYACREYRATLERHGVQSSMSRRGNCYDNAPMESFFKTFKTELVYQEQYRTREEARASIYTYIELFYNRQRLHSSLGYQSPVEFETRQR